MGDIQIHRLKGGSTVEIERKNAGRGHRYILNDGEPVGSVTGTLGHLDSDAFSIGLNWGLKMARLEDGNLDAARQAGADAQKAGTLLHSQVESFINDGTIAEDETFLAWHHLMSGLELSEGFQFTATERFVYDPELMIGGTIDCIVQSLDGGEFHVYDWKTKERESFDKYGPSAKDFTQVAGYVHALRAMNSEWAPSKAFLVYVMRDGSRAERVEVPLKQYMPIYKAARQLHGLLEEVK
jgi:hypothetical protein